MRLRGKIDGTDAHSTTVTTRERKIVKLTIMLDTQYCCIQAMKMAEIKAGSCVDAAGKSGKDGAIEALEVVFFPEEGAAP